MVPPSGRRYVLRLIAVWPGAPTPGHRVRAHRRALLLNFELSVYCVECGAGEAELLIVVRHHRRPDEGIGEQRIGYGHQCDRRPGRFRHRRLDRLEFTASAACQGLESRSGDQQRSNRGARRPGDLTGMVGSIPMENHCHYGAVVTGRLVDAIYGRSWSISAY